MESRPRTEGAAGSGLLSHSRASARHLERLAQSLALFTFFPPCVWLSFPKFNASTMALCFIAQYTQLHFLPLAVIELQPVVR